MLLPTGGAALVAQVFAFGCTLGQRDKGNGQDRTSATICPSPGHTLQFSLHLFIIDFIPYALSGLFRHSGCSRVLRTYF